ncbi:MAG: hypothetical protein QOG56_1931 [Solirubrobacteraceae bacterium]|jgi:hypothetical protein|nr:hypothetical protein [Solirubrobacteraceae bacterium]
MLGAGSTTFVSPSWQLIAWTVACLLLVPCGVVTGAKGRWGWLTVGLVLGGLPWVGAAFLPAAPGSWWARRAARRAG